MPLRYSKFILQTKLTFFLKLSLYFNTYSYGFSKIYNLKSYLFGTRSKLTSGLINPFKSITSIYNSFYVIQNIVKYNGTILLFNELKTSTSRTDGILTDIPCVLSIEGESVIPGFLTNQSWSKWFFLENAQNSTFLKKPDLVIFMNNSTDSFTHLREVCRGTVPVILFCDYTKPKLMFSIDSPIALPNGLRLDNSLLFLKIIYWYIWDLYKIKILKSLPTSTKLTTTENLNLELTEPSDSTNFFLGTRLNKKHILYVFKKKFYTIERKRKRIDLFYRRLLKKAKSRQPDRLAILLKSEYYRSFLKKPERTIEVVKFYRNKGRLLRVSKKMSIQDKVKHYKIINKLKSKKRRFKLWNKKIKKRIYKRKKWKLYTKYKKLFCSKFNSRLKLHKYRNRLLLRILCNYFDYSYNFKTWWREVKTKSLFKRLVFTFSKNSKYSSKLHEFLNKFDRQVGLLCRKLNIIPSLNSYKYLYNNKIALVNGSLIKNPMYLVKNNSIFSVQLFRTNGCKKKQFNKKCFATTLSNFENTSSILRLIRSKFFTDALYLKYSPQRRERFLAS